jgi:Tfp pilus assembly protein PilF
MDEDEPLTRQGTELRHEDRHDEAVEVLREAVAAGEWGAPRELAYALLGSDRPREALNVVKQAIRAGRLDLNSLLGSLAAELGDATTADTAYRMAISAGDLSALNDYGIFLGDQGRYEEAVGVLRRSAALGDVLAPGNLVALYSDDLNDLDSAREFGEKYLEPRRSSVYPVLADVYKRLGRIDKAESLFRQAVELDAPRVHQQYGWFLWHDRKDLAGAEREFWSAFDHDEAGWSYALGSFLVGQGRLEEAHAVLERGLLWGDLDARDLLAELRNG